METNLRRILTVKSLKFKQLSVASVVGLKNASEELGVCTALFQTGKAL